MANNFIIQGFQNLQNVNPDDMNAFYNDKDNKLDSYFPNSTYGSICSGIGSINNNYGQLSCNIFNIQKGVIRFPDALYNPNTSVGIIKVFANIDAQTITFTLPTQVGQYYAIVTYTNNVPLASSPRYTVTPTINTTLYTLAQIQALTQPVLVLFGINFTDVSVNPVCSVFVDNNCATNYNNQPTPAIYQQGRLGLVSNNPYKDSNFSQSLYFTPTNNGNLISLYNTIYNTWVSYIFSECSLNISTYAVGIYDVYIYNNYGQLTLYLDSWVSNLPQNRSYLNGKIVYTGNPGRLFLGSIQIHAIGTYAIDKIRLQSATGINNPIYLSNVSIMKKLAPSSNGLEVFIIWGYNSTSDLPISSFILNDIGGISTDEGRFDTPEAVGIATKFATNSYIDSTDLIKYAGASVYPSNVGTYALGSRRVELYNRTATPFISTGIAPPVNSISSIGGLSGNSIVFYASYNYTPTSNLAAYAMNQQSAQGYIIGNTTTNCLGSTYILPNLYIMTKLSTGTNQPSIMYYSAINDNGTLTTPAGNVTPFSIAGTVVNIQTITINTGQYILISYVPYSSNAIIFNLYSVTLNSGVPTFALLGSGYTFNVSSQTPTFDIAIFNNTICFGYIDKTSTTANTISLQTLSIDPTNGITLISSYSLSVLNVLTDVIQVDYSFVANRFIVGYNINTTGANPQKIGFIQTIPLNNFIFPNVGNYLCNNRGIRTLYNYYNQIEYSSKARLDRVYVYNIGDSSIYPAYKTLGAYLSPTGFIESHGTSSICLLVDPTMGSIKISDSLVRSSTSSAISISIKFSSYNSLFSYTNNDNFITKLVYGSLVYDSFYHYAISEDTLATGTTPVYGISLYETISDVSNVMTIVPNIKSDNTLRYATTNKISIIGTNVFQRVVGSGYTSAGTNSSTSYTDFTGLNIKHYG